MAERLMRQSAPAPTLLLVGSGAVRSLVEGCGYTAAHVSALDAAALSQFVNVVIIAPDETYTQQRLESNIRSVRKAYVATFIAVVGREASENPFVRLSVFDQGANMATADQNVLLAALHQIKNQRQTGQLTCAFCGLRGMSEDALWVHVPLFHANEKNITAMCPICKTTVHEWPVHYRHSHGPAGRGEVPEDRRAVKLYPFGLVVCRRKSDGKYLLVQEFSNSGYWVPGGHVNPGEDLAAGAIRETLEEAGVHVDLKGVLRVEYWPDPKVVKLRVIYYAEPEDETQPAKSIPDFESVGAAWASTEEIRALAQAHRLRGSEPVEWADYLAQGGPIHPLSVLHCFVSRRK